MGNGNSLIDQSRKGGTNNLIGLSVLAITDNYSNRVTLIYSNPICYTN